MPVPSEISAAIENLWTQALQSPGQVKTAIGRVQWNQYEVKVAVNLTAGRDSGDLVTVTIRSRLK